MPRVEDLLRDVLRHNLVQHVVRGQRQRLLVHEQPLCQQGVQIMWRHYIVLASVGEEREINFQLINRIEDTTWRSLSL